MGQFADCLFLAGVATINLSQIY